MLSITGIHNFYFLPHFHDMRCKARRVSEMIRAKYHRDPLNGDVYIFMSKDQTKVKMVHYENHAFYVHEKSFVDGYKFVKLVFRDNRPVYKLEWKALVAVLESPVIKSISLTEDGLIREIQLKQQLSELDGSRVSDYDSSDSMTAEELRRDNRFLIEQLLEAQKENKQLREDMAEIKAELKLANCRADEEAAGRKRLFDKLERFMDEQKSASDEVEKLKRKLETAENRLALANAALYNGSKTCSDKYSGQKNDGINDGRDDFDGTQESLPANTPGPIGSDRDKSSSDGKSDKETSSEDGHDSDNLVEEIVSGDRFMTRVGACRQGRVA